MTTYRLKKTEFVHTPFGDTTLWMNTVNSNFIELNETSTFLVDLLRNTPLTETDLIEAVCKEYDIPTEVCSTDIREALQELVIAELLEVSMD